MNRLANENSPYLLQHQHNPVDWFAWGEEALEKAKREQKPIFLSIGYSACHWCHVMERESFEDQSTADLMNRYFVSIKVDREERPDLDSIYMGAVVSMTGQGGWPLSVFLTPQGEPFFGGTYFPPSRRYGMPAFREVLEGIAQTWQNDHERILQAGKDLTAHLQAVNILTEHNPVNISAADLEEAALKLVQEYDRENGGWGKAPKFPQPMAIEFLLLRAALRDKFALEIAVHALQKMAKGGMYDLIGGGFARYSTDAQWLIPHFEKMLYDNAQLARAYLHASLLTGDAELRSICESTLDFILRELSFNHGKDEVGFFSSLDADSEGEEGKFYLWSMGEIEAALPSAEDLQLIQSAYLLSAEGNFEGRNILTRRRTNSELADTLGIPIEKARERLAELNLRLLRIREQRIRPNTDDKILTAWNSLALVAFAEAARYLERADYLEIARKNARFLLNEMVVEGRILRSWRAGRAQHNGTLEDYAGLVLALLAVYQSDPDPTWFSAALALAEQMAAAFSDPEFGFFDTRFDQDDLLIRPKDLQDNATPAGNSLAANALLMLYALTGDLTWAEIAEKMITQMLDISKSYPTSFANWLVAAYHSLYPYRELAIIGKLDLPRTIALVSVPWESYRPDLVVAASDLPLQAGTPPVLAGRSLMNELPTAYLCQNFVCLMPVTDPELLRKQIDTN